MRRLCRCKLRGHRESDHRRERNGLGGGWCEAVDGDGEAEGAEDRPDIVIVQPRVATSDGVAANRPRLLDVDVVKAPPECCGLVPPRRIRGDLTECACRILGKRVCRYRFACDAERQLVR